MIATTRIGPVAWRQAAAAAATGASDDGGDNDGGSRGIRILSFAPRAAWSLLSIRCEVAMMPTHKPRVINCISTVSRDHLDENPKNTNERPRVSFAEMLKSRGRHEHGRKVDSLHFCSVP